MQQRELTNEKLANEKLTNEKLTNEEALRCIKYALNSDIHFDETLDCQLTCADLDWLELAEKAVEKQIPKSPLKQKIIYSTPHGEEIGEMLVCPKCKLQDNLIGLSKYKDDYCRRCGQAILWSD